MDAVMNDTPITKAVTAWHNGEITLDEALDQVRAAEYIVPEQDEAVWDWDGGDGVQSSYGQLAAVRFTLGLKNADTRPFRNVLDEQASQKQKVRAGVRRLRSPSR